MAKSKIVKLRISSQTLKEFPTDHITPKKRRKSSASNGFTSKLAATSIASPTPIKHETKLNTPIPSSRANTPSALDDGRRRARGGKAKGFKRSLLSSPAPSDIPLKQEPSSATSTLTGPTSAGLKTSTSKPSGTAGFGSNAPGDNKLDKGGQPARKWVKKPVDILSFTGYNIEFKSWSGDLKDGEENAKTEGDAKVIKRDDKDKGSSTKIQIKLNNKKLDVDDASVAGGNDSGDQSPGLPDDVSSIITSPEGSSAATPVS